MNGDILEEPISVKIFIMRDWIKYYAILCAVELNYILLIAQLYCLNFIFDGHPHGTQLIAAIEINRNVGTHIFAESTNEGWNFISSDAAFWFSSRISWHVFDLVI